MIGIILLFSPLVFGSSTRAYARRAVRTFGGNAEGQNCHFPFTVRRFLSARHFLKHFLVFGKCL